jgi:hypothetical protein
MYRGLRTNPVDFMVKGAILAAASLALWAMYKDDDRYKELEDYEKFTYYHFWIGEEHFRIPKPFETGVIFSTSVETLGNIANNNEDMQFLIKFATFAAGETMAFNPMPQTFRPIYEAYSNKSMFTGRPIEGRRLQARKPGLRADPWTSEALQVVGEGLNISPKKMEALARGYLASMSTFLLAGPDQMARWFGDFPEKPTPRSDDYPLMGRFWRQGPARNTKSMTRFYELLTESNELVASVKHYAELGNAEKVKKLLARNKKLYAYNPTLRSYQRSLSEIRKSMEVVYKSRKSAEWKREMIDKLTGQRNAVVKKVYDLYRGKL